MMKPSQCPRCDGQKIVIIGKSPKKAVWELFRCEKCQFIWRSTETSEMLTTMRLTDEEIREIPPVPPLSQK